MTVTVRDGRATAQVRYKGISIAQTFGSSKAAEKWERRVKSAIDEARWPDRELIPPHLWPKWGFGSRRAANSDAPNIGWSLDKALRHYADNVTPSKKGATQELNRIAWWRRQSLASKRLDELTARDLQQHVNDRLAAGRAANTVRNEVFLLSAIYEHARAADIDDTGTHGWGLTMLVNPVPSVVLPPPPPARHRRLEDADGKNKKGEEERLRKALSEGPDGAEMVALFAIAIETGMRLGEVLDIRLGQVRSAQGTPYVARPDSKNMAARRVVLSSRAVAALDDYLETLPGRKRGDSEAKVFRLGTAAVEYRWKKARKAAEVTGLRFHDLRHEGLSRMAEAGLNIGELKAQSGHKTAQILLGYVNAKAAEVAKKLG